MKYLLNFFLGNNFWRLKIVQDWRKILDVLRIQKFLDLQNYFNRVEIPKLYSEGLAVHFFLYCFWMIHKERNGIHTWPTVPWKKDRAISHSLKWFIVLSDALCFIYTAKHSYCISVIYWQKDITQWSRLLDGGEA